MGKGESCNGMLLQQDTVTGADNVHSSCTVVRHSSRSVLPCSFSRRGCCSHNLGVKPTQHTLYHADLSLIKYNKEKLRTTWTSGLLSSSQTTLPGEKHSLFFLTYFYISIFTYVLILELLERTKPLSFILLIYCYVQLAFLFRQFFTPLHFFHCKIYPLGKDI